MRRWLIVGLAGVLLAGGWAWFYSASAVWVQVAEASRGRLREYVEERAKTRLPRVYRINMPISGRIRPITLIEGERVHKDQKVAELETADLETAVLEGAARVKRLANTIVENDDRRLEDSAIEQLDKVLESMDRTVESADAQTKSSWAKLDFADKEFKRNSTLFERQAISESELNGAELFLIESRVAYQKDVLTLAAARAIRSAVSIGRESIVEYIEKKGLKRAILQQEEAEAEATLDRLKRDYARAVILSPTDGVVLKRIQSNERVLAAGETLLEIGRLEDLEVEAEILSQDVVRVKPGNAVDIEGPAIGESPVHGYVSRIYPQGFTKISSLGVEQQRVLVIIEFDADEISALNAAGRSLGADYRVRVRIYTAEAPNALKLPRTALFRSAGGTWQAFRVRDNRAELVDLKTGLTNDSEVEILTGIKQGDLVILAPESSLEPGVRVKTRRIPKG